MKKFSLVFALFMLFSVVSCDSSPKFENPYDEKSDAYNPHIDECTSHADCNIDSYCDLETPSKDNELGTIVYHCKKRGTCQNHADCPIHWKCYVRKGLCITEEEADMLLCKSNRDCEDPSLPVCDLKTGLCVYSENETSDNTDDNTDNDGVCETAQTRTAGCQPKPDNTVWNTVDAITQTYTSSGWEPSTTPVYNPEPSENECRYKCASGYSWNGGSCQSNGGSSLPECSKTSGTPCYDSTSHLTWSKISSSTMTWSAATTFCQGSEMNGYGGFTDWRLPNIDELKTLITVSSGTPRTQNCAVSEATGHLASSDWTCSTCTEACTQSTSGTGCSSCNGSSDGRYSKLGDGEVWLWSSSLRSDGSGNAWGVGFYDGYVDDFDVDNGSYFVRCVR